MIETMYILAIVVLVFAFIVSIRRANRNYKND